MGRLERSSNTTRSLMDDSLPKLVEGNVVRRIAP